MSTIIQEKQFSCFNDCKQSGCPSHKMELSIQTTSEALMVKIDGEIVFGADPCVWETMMELVKRCDYNFFEAK